MIIDGPMFIVLNNLNQCTVC